MSVSVEGDVDASLWSDLETVREVSFKAAAAIWKTALSRLSTRVDIPESIVLEQYIEKQLWQPIYKPLHPLQSAVAAPEYRYSVPLTQVWYPCRLHVLQTTTRIEKSLRVYTQKMAQRRLISLAKVTRDKEELEWREGSMSNEGRSPAIRRDLRRHLRRRGDSRESETKEKMKKQNGFDLNTEILRCSASVGLQVGRINEKNNDQGGGRHDTRSALKFGRAG